MSTTWNTLKITANLMRSGNDDFLSLDYDDTQLEGLYQDIAKAEMKEDICKSLSLIISETADMTTLDEVVDRYASELSTALMYKQLYYFYYNMSSDKEGKAYQRMKAYELKYNDKKSLFSTMTLTNTSAVKTMRLLRG